MPKYYLLSIAGRLKIVDGVDTYIITHEQRPCEHSKIVLCRENPNYKCIIEDCKCPIRYGITPMCYPYTNRYGNPAIICEESHSLMKVEEDE